MTLEMRTACETCSGAVGAADETYICSYECTYCASCASGNNHVCPNCGGELVRRPTRIGTTQYQPRMARAEDREALARLAGELGYASTPEEIQHRLGQLSMNDAVLVIQADGEVQGWLHVAIVSSLETGSTAQIMGLVVSEPRRGAGIGTALVRAAEEWARGRRTTRIRVRTNVTRTRTHAFYERCGFVHTKTSRLYEKSL